jgi:hypothetical protein
MGPAACGSAAQPSTRTELPAFEATSNAPNGCVGTVTVLQPIANVFALAPTVVLTHTVEVAFSTGTTVSKPDREGAPGIVAATSRRSLSAGTVPAVFPSTVTCTVADEPG